mmetsp:Transcript_99069/g.221971  ORF Transcript_99069/g.221971 Transcript_99069/m.221971 type:complete len:223 (-) Transcript_99069:1594-2262(-)
MGSPLCTLSPSSTSHSSKMSSSSTVTGSSRTSRSGNANLPTVTRSLSWETTETTSPFCNCSSLSVTVPALLERTNCVRPWLFFILATASFSATLSPTSTSQLSKCQESTGPPVLAANEPRSPELTSRAGILPMVATFSLSKTLDSTMPSRRPFCKCLTTPVRAALITYSLPAVSFTVAMGAPSSTLSPSLTWNCTNLRESLSALATVAPPLAVRADEKSFEA